MNATEQGIWLEIRCQNSDQLRNLALSITGNKTTKDPNERADELTLALRFLLACWILTEASDSAVVALGKKCHQFHPKPLPQPPPQHGCDEYDPIADEYPNLGVPR